MFLKVFYGDDIKVYRDIDNTFFSYSFRGRFDDFAV